MVKAALADLTGDARPEFPAPENVRRERLKMRDQRLKMRDQHLKMREHHHLTRCLRTLRAATSGGRARRARRALVRATP